MLGYATVIYFPLKLAFIASPTKAFVLISERAYKLSQYRSEEILKPGCFIQLKNPFLFIMTEESYFQEGLETVFWKAHWIAN